MLWATPLSVSLHVRFMRFLAEGKVLLSTHETNGLMHLLYNHLWKQMVGVGLV